MKKNNKPQSIFSTAQKELNPEVVFHNPKIVCGTGFDTKNVKGSFFRIIPDGYREIFLLQMLEMHCEKYAPARGNGLLITKAAFEKLTA
jgi:hypothetical protein